MRCVPTCALMDKTDPELDRAHQRLSELLAMVERRLRGMADATPRSEDVPGHDHDWRYVGSTPWREDDGTIVYMHGFRHARLVRAGEPLAIAIPSSPRWWPVGCGQRSPRRTAARGKLRLVS